MATMAAKASITIEAVVSDNTKSGGAAGGGTPEDEVSESTVISKEQILTVSIELSNENQTQLQRSQTHLVVVVDRSGSMAGQPWTQVKESLHAILGSCADLSHMKTDLIVYNDKAQAVPFTKSNYKEIIDGLTASGTTSFLSAFRKVYDAVSGTGPEYTATVVVFLTDGHDTVNKPKDISQLSSKLKAWFAENNKHATVHTVGFSKDHDFKFLKKLAEDGGTSAGMFRYCEPGDDRHALQSKLDELFDFIIQSDDRKVTINMLGEKCLILDRSERSKSATLLGKVVNTDESLQNQVTLLAADAWIYLDDPIEIPALTVSMETDTKIDGTVRQVSTPCQIVSIERKMIDSPAEKTKWRLRILERNVEDLMNQTATAVAQKTDISHLQARVEKYQNRIAHTRVFGNGISRGDRHAMFDLIKDVQTNLDQIQKMLAEYMRSGTDSVSLLARAHDMRFQAVGSDVLHAHLAYRLYRDKKGKLFNKSRRQRVMDKRASKNMQHAANAQKELASLVVDRDEVGSLTQDAMDFFFCVMSQNSVKDVLLSDDMEDAIGFGLAVKRSEVVLDEPTLVRIHVISGTLASRNAMLDALEYKINVSSQLKAHGGFEFDQKTFGVTTVGTGREPINAWLPLYVTKSHWDRIKVILKPALGSFCTLDPLGYHFKQLDIMFMVLGSMIGQLSDDSIGEHQLKLLFSVLRTCSACLVDFDKTTEATDIVKEFVTSLAGRTKDIIPNLHTLVGYIVSLPPKTRCSIFPTEETIQQFWLAFVAEWLRRAAGSVYKESSLVSINGAVNSLVNGEDAETGHSEVKKPACSFTKELERMCLQADKHTPNIKAFDPASDIKAPDIELKHSEMIDRAMEIWAEKHTGHQKNIGKTKKYKAALRQVNDWLSLKTEKDNVSKLQDVAEVTDDVEESDTENDTELEDETQEAVLIDGNAQAKKLDAEAETIDFDIENVTAYILEVIAKVQRELINSAYPSLHSLPGLIAFVNTWLVKEHNVVDMDANSGIAPDMWISEIKSAVSETYAQLKAELKSTVNPEAEETVKAKEMLNESDGTVVGLAETIKDKEQNHKDINTGVNQVGDEFQSDYGVDENYSGDDDDDDDDDGGDEDEDDDDFDYDYTIASARSGGKKKKKEICFSLPQIMRLIDGQADVVQTLRAILCQSIRFHSNNKARAAIASKELLDTAGGKDTVRLILGQSYKYLDEFKVNARESVVQKALWKRANYCMIHATTPWAFVGYLMNTHSSRNDGFSDLIDLLMASVTKDAEIPFLKEKVHMLLTGKYQDCPVLDNGNQWLPEKKMAGYFKKLLGEEIWSEFEMELRSSVQIHVYRESDIPNRHGHCNSNPYIPNILRRKLGMKLLPEPKGRRSRKSRR